ncbi:putative anaphase-promoting complex subunit 8 [Monocercomonoides exilis]|uniref:putative anaphase-promoting complex subunit 8 n=1 Tax=Monocercomonoides exilis TaxID=2049356 RepID=UPI00355A7E77|nr:putative anaphase-promoting complex subunit 8 [Monocercomonoides exilis]|eukprot:MONOS_3444.1-p1 / transcript=MONOS_3444.1 / gene=MONOS_3444 / organism=Monocercomonoides_exilis_PA203 / gene_product=unspecified product / transcript_product=unspecified product / location=Mono_scaffold00081:70314-73304(+) / protein_length=806 / sequence_SO=supercontig / SO=protein_coding / is_pseudo=false
MMQPIVTELNPSHEFSLANLYFESGEYTQCFSLLEQQKKLVGLPREMQFLRLYSLFFIGEREKYAEFALRKSTGLAQKDEMINKRLSQVLSEIEAIESYEDDAFLIFLKAKVLKASNRLTECILNYAKVIKRMPCFWEPWRDLLSLSDYLHTYSFKYVATPDGRARTSVPSFYSLITHVDPSASPIETFNKNMLFMKLPLSHPCGLLFLSHLAVLSSSQPLLYTLPPNSSASTSASSSSSSSSSKAPTQSPLSTLIPIGFVQHPTSQPTFSLTLSALRQCYAVLPTCPAIISLIIQLHAAHSNHKQVLKWAKHLRELHPGVINSADVISDALFVYGDSNGLSALASELSVDHMFHPFTHYVLGNLHSLCDRPVEAVGEFQLAIESVGFGGATILGTEQLKRLKEKLEASKPPQASISESSSSSTSSSSSSSSSSSPSPSSLFTSSPPSFANVTFPLPSPVAVIQQKRAAAAIPTYISNSPSSFISLLNISGMPTTCLSSMLPSNFHAFFDMYPFGTSVFASSCLVLMGHELIQLGRAAEALVAYRMATQMWKSDYRSWFGLGQAQELLDMEEESEAYYARACQLKPEDPRMWMALGICQEKRKRISAALTSYKKAEKMLSTPSVKLPGEFFIKDVKEQDPMHPTLPMFSSTLLATALLPLPSSSSSPFEFPFTSSFISPFTVSLLAEQQDTTPTSATDPSQPPLVDYNVLLRRMVRLFHLLGNEKEEAHCHAKLMMGKTKPTNDEEAGSFFFLALYFLKKKKFDEAESLFSAIIGSKTSFDDRAQDMLRHARSVRNTPFLKHKTLK